MTEYTDEFKAEFRGWYGVSWARQLPDYTRCANETDGNIMRGEHPHQCSRKNGYGPHGAYCRQHDPVAAKAKRDARTAKWDAKWAAEKRKREFISACQDAVRQIAEGHSDPRGLCKSIIAALKQEEETK